MRTLRPANCTWRPAFGRSLSFRSNCVALTLALAACGGDGGAEPGLPDVSGRLDVPASPEVGRADALPDVAPPDALPDAAPPDGPSADAAPLPDACPPDAALVDPAPEAWPRFRFAIATGDRGQMMSVPLFHMDHDPVAHPEATGTCTNFEGQHFPFCYDEHDGSDFVLRGGFVTMDHGSAAVVAAAGGIVEATEDGHYDRCHGSAETLTVECDGHEMRANFVRLRHANGWVTDYYHLKSGSVLVASGERVACGDPLGLVGSSGYSILPHLHFEVTGPTGEVVDPFAGPNSQPTSLFTEQKLADGFPGGVCDPAWTLPPE